jgi:hypothetical protein
MTCRSPSAATSGVTGPLPAPSATRSARTSR